MQKYSSLLLDKNFRKRIRVSPKLIIKEIDNNIKYKIVTNTKDTIYLVFSNTEINLGKLQAGIKASTTGSIGCVGSAGTVGSYACATAPSTVGSASSLGSLGSLGSINPNS